MALGRDCFGATIFCQWTHQRSYLIGQRPLPAKAGLNAVLHEGSRFAGHAIGPKPAPVPDPTEAGFTPGGLRQDNAALTSRGGNHLT